VQELNNQTLGRLPATIELPAIMFTIVFLLTGLFLLKGIAASFAVDRWTPPLDAPDKTDRYRP